MYARGVDVISSYEAKPYRSSSDPEQVTQFEGTAVWSGTSFAAPYVSAKVAEVLQASPELGRDEVVTKLRELGDNREVQGLGWFVP